MYGCGIHSAEYHTIQSSCRPTSHHQISARDRDDWYDDGHREVGGEDRDFTLAQQDDGFVENVEKPPRKPVASRKCTSPGIADSMDKAATIPASRPAMTLMMNVDRGNALCQIALM